MILQLYRKSTHEDSYTYQPSDFVESSSIKVIGSVLDGMGPLRGVGKEEEKALLPAILGISANSPDFEDRAQKFWTDIRIKVPASGVQFDLRKDKEGTPYNVMDYLKGKFVLNHPDVAESQDEMEKSSDKYFYVTDAEREKRKKYQRSKIMKKAYRLLDEASGDDAKLYYIFSVLAPASDFTGLDKLDPEDAEYHISNYLENNPEYFIEVVSDKNLKNKAEIEAMVKTGVLEKIGNEYIYKDTTIGSSIQQVIAYMKHPKHSRSVISMRAELKSRSGKIFDSIIDTLPEDIGEQEEEKSPEKEEVQSEKIETSESGVPQPAKSSDKKPGPKPKGKGKSTSASKSDD